MVESGLIQGAQQFVGQQLQQQQQPQQQLYTSSSLQQPQFQQPQQPLMQPLQQQQQPWSGVGGSSTGGSTTSSVLPQQLQQQPIGTLTSGGVSGVSGVSGGVPSYYSSTGLTSSTMGSSLLPQQQQLQQQQQQQPISTTSSYYQQQQQPQQLLQQQQQPISVSGVSTSGMIGGGGTFAQQPSTTTTAISAGGGVSTTTGISGGISGGGMVLDGFNLLLQDQKDIMDLFDNHYLVERDNSHKRQILSLLIEELCIHSSIDEVIVFPLIEILLPEGKRLAERNYWQHLLNRIHFQKILEMNMEDKLFESSVQHMMVYLRDQMKNNEFDIYAHAKQRMTQEQLAVLYRLVEAARQLAPSVPRDNHSWFRGRIVEVFDDLKYSIKQQHQQLHQQQQQQQQQQFVR